MIFNTPNLFMHFFIHTKKCSYLIALLCALAMQVSVAQQSKVKIRGKVLNDKNELVKDVFISIGQSIAIQTESNGSFQVIPSIVKTEYNKDDIKLAGYRVIEIQGSIASSYVIKAIPATKIQGYVIDQKLKNRLFKVELQDEFEKEATYTKENGYFVLNGISAKILSENPQSIRFWVDNTELKSEYIKFSNNNTRVTLYPNAKEKVATMPDTDLEFVEEEVLAKQGDKTNKVSETNGFSLEFENITAGLLDDRQEGQKRAKRLKNELINLTQNFLKKQNISKEEQISLENYIKSIEDTFFDNDSIFGTYQKESRNEIAKMQSIILKKDSLRHVAEWKAEKAEGEKKEIQTEKELCTAAPRSKVSGGRSTRCFWTIAR